MRPPSRSDRAALGRGAQAPARAKWARYNTPRLVFVIRDREGFDGYGQRRGNFLRASCLRSRLTGRYLFLRTSLI